MQGRLVKSENKKFIQYFPDKNWIKEIELANKHNFRLMEWTANIENIKKNPVYRRSLINKTKKILKKNNVKVNSLTCDFFMQKPFFKNKRKKHYLDLLKKVIVNCQLLKIKFIIIPLVDNSSIENMHQEKNLINEMLKLSKLLTKTKILFEIDYKPNNVLKFIKNFNSKFGINYDTGNSAALNYKIEDEKKFFKFVKNIHIKDRKKYQHSVRLGTGNWKYKKFFNFVKKKYKGNLILQTARSKNNNDIEEILINREFVKRYL